MKIGEQVAIYNDFKVNKNQSKYAGENILIFLKQIYDPKSDKNYDWIFSTNVEKIILEDILNQYEISLLLNKTLRIKRHAFPYRTLSPYENFLFLGVRISF